MSSNKRIKTPADISAEVALTHDADNALSQHEALTQPSRARPSRDEETQVRRRRRGPNDNGLVKRLAVPEDKLDRKAYAYRWVNDTPGRIPMLHGQDWDVVSDEELTDDVGSSYSASRHADIAQNRVALTTRLMRKPREFFEEDHAAAQKRLDDEMKAAELGRTVLNGPQGESAGLDVNSPRVYAPNVETNKL